MHNTSPTGNWPTTNTHLHVFARTGPPVGPPAGSQCWAHRRRTALTRLGRTRDWSRKRVGLVKGKVKAFG